MKLDPFTPWQEDPASLAARHVGRREVLDWLVRGCTAFLEGRRPPWLYLVGPRGSGKSHLARMAANDVPPTGLEVVYVGEDIPLMQSADLLWERMSGRPLEWRGPMLAADRASGRRLVVVEGFDRQLDALGSEGRWQLRHLLQEAEDVFLVGTGTSTSWLRGEAEAFHGQLDVWALEPLSHVEAVELFERVSGEADRAPSPEFLTRRQTLVHLAGGNARAVVILARAVAGSGHDTMGAAEGLRTAVQDLVPHYQQRFRDLPPLGQRIVELLAVAPRELMAGEIQEALDVSSSAVSMTAKTLEAAGTLSRRADGRRSLYSLSEPMFRYWHEYRTAPWDQTRIGWLAHLLGAVLTRHELQDVWWTDPTRMAVAWSKAPVDEWLGSWSHDAPVVAAMRRFCRDLRDQPSRWRATFLRLVDELADIEANPDMGVLSDVVRELLDRTEPRGAPWTLNVQEQELLAEVPFLRARFSNEGRLATHPPLLKWERLTAIDLESAPDIAELLEAAHQRRDVRFFRRLAVAAKERGASVLLCLRPEVPAPDTDALAAILPSEDLAVTLTWAASFADIAAESWARVLDRLALQSRFEAGPMEWFIQVALLSLRQRNEERFAALRSLLSAQEGLFAAVERLSLLLQEGARGLLHPELELVARALEEADHASPAND